MVFILVEWDGDADPRPRTILLQFFWVSRNEAGGLGCFPFVTAFEGDEDRWADFGLYSPRRLDRGRQVCRSRIGYIAVCWGKDRSGGGACQ
jgi:hypothetical protein